MQLRTWRCEKILPWRESQSMWNGMRLSGMIHPCATVYGVHAVEVGKRGKERSIQGVGGREGEEEEEMANGAEMERKT